MRQERTVQASVFDLFAEHEIGHELKALSQWLDEHRDLLGLTAARKLSVIMHSMLKTGEVFNPLAGGLKFSGLQSRRHRRRP